MQVYYYNGMAYFGPNDISHHGILGMKWGKRNGPPYPLRSADHSASEKKAGWRKSLGSPRKETGEAKNSNDNNANKAGGGAEKRENDKIIRDIQKSSRKEAREISKERFNYYKEKGKEIVHSKGFKIAVGVAAAAIVTYAAYKIGKPKLDAFLANGEKIREAKIAERDLRIKEALGKVYNVDDLSTLDDANKKLVEMLKQAYNKMPQKYKDVSSLPKSSKKYLDSIESVVNGINEGGFGSIKGRDTNCVFCSSAIIMRLKGYEVSSQRSPSSVGWPEPVLGHMFKDQVSIKPGLKNYKELIEMFESLGEGRYGMMKVGWQFGGFHEVAWIIKDGKLKILDGQVEKIFNADEFFKKISPSETVFSDLTNNDISEYVLKALK